MKTEATTEITNCDGCGNRLVASDPFMHDGSFKPDWYTQEEMDICPTCIYEIFTKHLSGAVAAESMREYVKTTTRPYGNVHIPSLASDFLASTLLMDDISIIGTGTTMATTKIGPNGEILGSIEVDLNTGGK